jgi:hypothetical protein
VCGRPVKSVGLVTPDSHLDALSRLTWDVLNSSDGPVTFVEVGSWVGESAVAISAPIQTWMLQDLHRRGGSRLICVDHFKGTPTDHMGRFAKFCDARKFFLENTMHLPVKLMEMSSQSAASTLLFPLESGLIFLDAGHDYVSIKQDIDLWLPHLSDRGVICGHDYTLEFPGVIRAVKESFPGDSLRIAPGTSIWAHRRQWQQH